MSLITPTIEDTISLIQKAHKGQKDHSGQPYYTHPIRVWKTLVARFPDATLEEQHAALLHDVIEDTFLDENMLHNLNYNQKTIDIIKDVTRPEDKSITYHEWIKNIAKSNNIGSIRVKLCDNIDNTSPERLESLPPEYKSLEKRYDKARKILEDALNLQEIQKISQNTSIKEKNYQRE